MGRRKERRLAAMSAAGRRVKLDLFAEPSGDLGGSSTQAEAGGEDNSKYGAGVPNSPSSSGEQPANPLLLLGQYSDDELDEESVKEQDVAVSENPSETMDDQAKIVDVSHVTEVGDARSDFEDQNVGKLEVDNSSPSLSRPLENFDNGQMSETNTAEAGVTVPVTTQDASLGWRMVFDEQSNQYYYWNIATGQTSWEVPEDLSQTTDVAKETALGDSREEDVAFVGTNETSIGLDVKLDSSSSAQVNSDALTIHSLSTSEHKPKLPEGTEGCEGDSLGEGELKSNSVQCNSQEVSADEIEAPNLMGPFHAKYEVNGDCQPVEDSVSDLIKLCESLLGHLESFKRSECYEKAQEEISRYELEIQIRLADIKSLACYGSSLLPFWVHLQKHLKQLESNIIELELYRVEMMSKHEAAHKSDESGEVKVTLYEISPLSLGPKDSDPSRIVENSVEHHEHPYIQPYGDNLVDPEHVPSNQCPQRYPDGVIDEKVQTDDHVVCGESTPKTVLYSGDDVDMDVEMEVEDVAPHTDFYDRESPYVPHQDLGQNLNQQPPGNENSFATEQPPLPPNEDWIPPPPPDDEPVPPPPPDEPPESPCPPQSSSEAAEPLPYNLSYLDSNAVFYEQKSADVASNNFYYQSIEGAQVAVQPIYYEVTPSTFGAAPLVMAPLEPAAYYRLPDGALNTVSVSGGESSRYLGDPEHEVGTSGQRGSVEPDPGLFHVASVSFPTITRDEKDAALEVSSVEATANDLSMNGASVSSISTVAAAATVSKVQSKVSRVKKRASGAVSGLRSNKKVSSLVDKWKAAKEELHADEEEEPKSAYEKLEKKRQREIEEWHAQQLASGEAKDNANFQPLGGDWRERVRRRRAQRMEEDAEKPKEGTETTQQPDLGELSRGLPTGWQAFWDDSSKQVYYGNSSTSETTWIRPAQ